ncbi:MAG: NACHT domain-containing protein [Prochlorotrichaceae cyanobacterium]|jgi:hypothetical protein
MAANSIPDPGQFTAPPKEAARYLIRLVNTAFQTSTPVTTAALQTAIATAVDKYVAFYTQSYTFIQLPGVDRPIPLSRIYVPLQVVDERSIRSTESPKTLKQLHRQRQTRDQEKRVRSLRASLDVANQKQYLLVFGEPGYGKSTFLRWLGIEVLQGSPQSSFAHLCFPVFIPLRYTQEDSFNLETLLVEIFSRCGFPHAARLVDILLRQGNVLLLLDGLDEVPSAQFLTMQQTIEAFVEKYPKNRYVLSCRKAAGYLSLKRFVAVDIAPLNSQQVAMLIRKHLLLFLGVVPDLVVHLKNLTIALGSSRLRDLIWNPLFLVTLCRVYSQTQQLPGNPSAVYREAIDLVLEAVDPKASNLKILQEATLTAEVEKALLSELAHQGLIKQQLVYPGEPFEHQIQDFLAETLTLATQPKIQELLHRLVKQGLLLSIHYPPGESYYSFSHRSLQEFLTARYLAQYDTPIEPVVSQYATDLHWREVFIFLAAQVDRSDRLLELLAEAAQQQIQSDRLQRLLTWTAQVTQPSQGPFSPVVKRTIALAIALDRALDMTRSIVVDQAIDRALNLSLDLVLVLDHQVALELERIILLDLDVGPGGNLDLDFPLNVALELKRLQVFPDGRMAWLISRLKALKSHGLEVSPEGVKEVFSLWLQALNLEEEWLKLSPEEAQQLYHYLQICLLIQRCRRVAVRVSRQTWEQLESQILCPNPSLL